MTARFLKPGCSKPGCLQNLHGSALLRPFAFFCGRAFALFCAHLRSFAHICVFLHPTALRMTAFGNCRASTEGEDSQDCFREGCAKGSEKGSEKGLLEGAFDTVLQRQRHAFSESTPAHVRA